MSHRDPKKFSFTRACYQCYHSRWHSCSSEILKRKWFGRFGKRRLKQARLSKRLTAVFCEVSCCPGKARRLSKKHSLKCRTMETTRFLNESEESPVRLLFDPHPAPVFC